MTHAVGHAIEVSREGEGGCRDLKSIVVEGRRVDGNNGLVSWADEKDKEVSDVVLESNR